MIEDNKRTLYMSIVSRGNDVFESLHETAEKANDKALEFWNSLSYETKRYMKRNRMGACAVWKIEVTEEKLGEIENGETEESYGDYCTETIHDYIDEWSAFL